MLSNTAKEYEYFLGGADAEMRAIKEYVIKNGFTYYDKALAWGAKASDYMDELAACKGIPVLIELDMNIEVPNAVVIDHHGARAGELPSLIQFLNLVGITPTRKDNLIGAMDAAYVYGLIDIGASLNEIVELLGSAAYEKFEKQVQNDLKNWPVPFRHEDEDKSVLRGMLVAATNSQYHTEVIRAAEKAIQNKEVIGNLIILRCEHSICAPITARLFGTQPYQNILIVSDSGEVNYFSVGENIRRLLQVFGDIGWSGGAGLIAPTKESIEFWTQYGGKVPSNAFWGANLRGGMRRNVIGHIWKYFR